MNASLELADITRQAKCVGAFRLSFNAQNSNSAEVDSAIPPFGSGGR